jgi:predicted alpha/beta superfamily hydrolase
MIKRISSFLFVFGCIATAYGQSIHVSSGASRRIENFPSQYVPARNIDIWVPDGYSTSKKYAVLYMHDGQMLFDSTINWNQQEWGVDETMGDLEARHRIRDCIVVGIWNVAKIRHAEYFPEKALAGIPENRRAPLLRLLDKGPQADSYLRFMVHELKPFIDSVFSTVRDRSGTFVAGSSMGGLISMYAICEYPDVFGGAACLSTHWTGTFRADDNPIPDAILGYLADHLPPPETHKIYFDHGTGTLDSLYAPFQKKADAIMESKHYTPENWETRVFPGEDHSEHAWRRRFAIPVAFLLKPI